MNKIAVNSIEIAEKAGNFRDELNFRIKFKVLRSLHKDVEWLVQLKLDGGNDTFDFHLGGKKMRSPKKDSYTLNFRLHLPKRLDVPFKYLRGKSNICVQGQYNTKIHVQKNFAFDIYYEDPDMNLMPPPLPIMKNLMWKIIPDEMEQANDKVEEQQAMPDDSATSNASSTMNTDEDTPLTPLSPDEDEKLIA